MSPTPSSPPARPYPHGRAQAQRAAAARARARQALWHQSHQLARGAARPRGAGPRARPPGRRRARAELSPSRRHQSVAALLCRRQARRKARHPQPPHAPAGPVVSEAITLCIERPTRPTSPICGRCSKTWRGRKSAKRAHDGRGRARYLPNHRRCQQRLDLRLGLQLPRAHRARFITAQPQVWIIIPSSSACGAPCSTPSRRASASRRSRASRDEPQYREPGLAAALHGARQRRLRGGRQPGDASSCKNSGAQAQEHRAHG